jgi:hypothetical protein
MITSPEKKSRLAASRKSTIHQDKCAAIRLVRQGTDKKNIVTNPLSLSVRVKAI